MARRWVRWTAASAVAVLAAAGCSAGTVDEPGIGRQSRSGIGAGGGGGRETPASQAAAAAIESRLQEMTRALAAGNGPAFLAGVDPAAGAVRASQARTFANLRRLPVRDVTYTWPGREQAPVQRGDGTGADAVVARVQRSYRLDPWDAGPLAEWLDLTFAPRGDRWVLISDSRVPEAASPGPPEPWSVADVVAVRSGSALVVTERSRAAAGRRIARASDRAAVQARRLWSGVPWRGTVVVYAVSDPSFIRAWFGTHAPAGVAAGGTGAGERGPAEFDGLVAPVPAAAGTGTEGTRMVLTPSATKLGTAALDVLVRHEMTHVATSAREREAPAPVWLGEGIAEFAAYRRAGGTDGVAALSSRGLPAPLWTELHRSRYRPVLVPDRKFYEGTTAQVGRRYSDAWLTSLYVADRKGEATLARLYLAATDPARPDPVDRRVRAIADVLGTDQSGLERDVSRYARELRRRFA